ncbi:MAG: hypothetical protein ACJ741_13455 [Pyrinomonadaceae bacterium]
MKTYEDYSSSPDGWNVTSTLELADDGRFSYSEGRTDYTNASLSGGAGGTWRRGDGVIIFRAERVYPPIYFPWEVGRELVATVRDGALDFGRGWTLRPPPSKPEPEPPAPPRAPDAEAIKPAASQPFKPIAKPPVKPPFPSHAKATAPPFVPRAPSPELAALLRRWVDELTVDEQGNMINRLCKENDAIPLDCTEIYLWALRTDGQVLCIDHESFAQRAEPEENAEVAYDRIEVGARTHPELSELLPPERYTTARRSGN